jgi:hypothetical protein
MLPYPTYRHFGQSNPSALWARELYRSSAAGPLWHRLLAHRLGRAHHLPSLNQAAEQPATAGQRDGGLRTVRLDQICGSEGDGRARDFDDHFHPLNPSLTGRWLSVAQAWYEGVGLPPVEMVQVADCYYIRDGHHRVSVAGAAGSQAIQAHVIVKEPAGRP